MHNIEIETLNSSHLNYIENIPKNMSIKEGFSSNYLKKDFNSIIENKSSMIDVLHYSDHPMFYNNSSKLVYSGEKNIQYSLNYGLLFKFNNEPNKFIGTILKLNSKNILTFENHPASEEKISIDVYKFCERYRLNSLKIINKFKNKNRNLTFLDFVNLFNNSIIV
jgi:hypothetical protein